MFSCFLVFFGELGHHLPPQRLRVQPQQKIFPRFPLPRLAEPDNGGLHEPTPHPRRMPESSHRCRGALATVPVLHLGPIFSSVCSLLIFFFIFLFPLATAPTTLQLLFDARAAPAHVLHELREALVCPSDTLEPPPRDPNEGWAAKMCSFPLSSPLGADKRCCRGASAPSLVVSPKKKSIPKRRKPDA